MVIARDREVADLSSGFFPVALQIGRRSHVTSACGDAREFGRGSGSGN